MILEQKLPIGCGSKIASGCEIAVLVPTFKPESYIYRCLLSLDQQSLEKDRFFVYFALNGPQDPYKDYLLHALRKVSFGYEVIYIAEAGVSNARNALIDSSVEPFLAFVDDDDFLSENYLELLLLASSKSVVGISDVALFDGSDFCARESYLRKCYNNLNEFEVSKFKTRKYYSSPCAKLISRDIIGRVRFDLSLSKGEDALFMAEISPHVCGMRKAGLGCCYNVFERPGSASRSQSRRISEFKRTSYLVKSYYRMMCSTRYDKFFVLTRILATLRHLAKQIVRI